MKIIFDERETPLYEQCSSIISSQPNLVMLIYIKKYYL